MGRPPSGLLSAYPTEPSSLPRGELLDMEQR
jgi:hypothetical protein